MTRLLFTFSASAVFAATCFSSGPGALLAQEALEGPSAAAGPASGGESNAAPAKGTVRYWVASDDSSPETEVFLRDATFHDWVKKVLKPVIKECADKTAGWPVHARLAVQRPAPKLAALLVGFLVDTESERLDECIRMRVNVPKEDQFERAGWDQRVSRISLNFHTIGDQAQGPAAAIGKAAQRSMGASAVGLPAQCTQVSASSACGGGLQLGMSEPDLDKAIARLFPGAEISPVHSSGGRLDEGEAVQVAVGGVVLLRAGLRYERVSWLALYHEGFYRGGGSAPGQMLLDLLRALGDGMVVTEVLIRNGHGRVAHAVDGGPGYLLDGPHRADAKEVVALWLDGPSRADEAEADTDTGSEISAERAPDAPARVEKSQSREGPKPPAVGDGGCMARAKLVAVNLCVLDRLAADCSSPSSVKNKIRRQSGEMTRTESSFRWRGRNRATVIVDWVGTPDHSGACMGLVSGTVIAPDGAKIGGNLQPDELATAVARQFAAAALNDPPFERTPARAVRVTRCEEQFGSDKTMAGWTEICVYPGEDEGGGFLHVNLSAAKGGWVAWEVLLLGVD